MRIAFLDEYFVPDSPGGAEWSVYYLARAVAEAGHAVRILTPDLSTPQEIDEARRIDASLAEAGDARVIRFPFARKLGESKRAFPSYVFGNPFFHRKFARELLDRHKSEPFDLVHAQGLDSFAPAAEFRPRARRPCVATVRDYRVLCPVSICLHEKDRAPAGCTARDFKACVAEYLRLYGVRNTFAGRLRHGLRRRLEWRNSRCAGRALKSMDGAVFVSQRIADIYGDAGLLPRRSAMIHNLPPPETQPGDTAVLAARLGMGDRPVLAFVGRYSLGKGAKVLTEAMEIVGRRRPDAVCVVAGNREYAGESSNMIFADRLSQTDVRSLYALARAVVLPSRWQEPFSRVLFEAMQAGVPVIAADAGGNAEAVVDGVTGRIVPRNDPAALSQAVLDFLAMDDGERKAMGLAARELAQKKFRTTEIVAEVLQFYQAVIEDFRKNP